MKTKQWMLLLLLALPVMGLAQGKFGGGNGQGWAMETLLNQSLMVGMAPAQPSGSCVVYPNPVAGQLFVDQLGMEADYVICDALGRELMRGVAQPHAPIEVGRLSPGLYSIVVGGTARKFWKT